MMKNDFIKTDIKNKRRLSVIEKTYTMSIMFILICSVFTVFLPIKTCSASGNTIYVDDNGGADYTNIQDAINAASEGDTIYVYSGTYYESVTIGKSISLVGQDKETTIIEHSTQGYAVHLQANNCTVHGFTIRSENSQSAMELVYASNNNIYDNKFYGGLEIMGSPNRNNIISDNSFQGRIFFGCYWPNTDNDHNQILRNRIENPLGTGIEVDYFGYTTIDGNTITNCNGIVIESSNYTTIANNVITYNTGGVLLSYSNNNLIYANSISNNEYGGIIGWGINSNSIYSNIISNNNNGLSIEGTRTSYNNFIYNNTFSGNNNNAYDAFTNNWDNGYPLGNYWDNYFGSDKDNDGIGDIAFNIPGGNSIDHYPRGYFSPSFGLGYDSEKNEVYITNFEAGYHYSDSQDFSDAHVIFIKDGNPLDIYYVLSDLTVGSTGTLSTKEILANDKITNFPPGSYEMRLEPWGISVITFTVSFDSHQQGKGWVNGTVGRVFHNEIAPLENASIQIKHNGAILPTSPCTNEEGQFSSCLDAGVYSFSAWKDGWTRSEETTITVIAGRGTSLEFMLFPDQDSNLAWLYGSFLGGKQGEVPLSIEGVIIEVWKNGIFVDSASSDVQGYFEIHNLPLDTYRVQFTYPNGDSFNNTYVLSQPKGYDLSSISEEMPNLQKIKDAIDQGKVGCKMSIWKGQDNKYEDNISVYNGVEIKNLDVRSGFISFTVSGNESTGGKTIVLNVEDFIFSSLSDIIVQYDGKGINMADDINDVLDPNNDGSHPEYLIVLGSNGAQLLVSIPHFSEHSITFFNLTPEQAAQYLLYAVVAAVGLIIIAAVVMFRKGKED